MTINADDLFAKLPKARQKAILAQADKLITQELSLTKLRKSRRISQAKLARRLGIKQSAMSRLERRADMYLSTLRNVIKAMGGAIHIVAEFPGEPPVRINQFKELKKRLKSDPGPVSAQARAGRPVVNRTGNS